MSPFRTEAIPLNTPVTTKLNELEYRTLVNQAQAEGTTKTALIRLALRQYLRELATPAIP
ncbi:ribbon-helix-helix domain-containing protein [Trichocoleus desertorum AS-A10]|uniref:ribbon-helix-helix domain-containing protein n=1 Tax=Trichocoleus desertorum TaxID=1481672 RepID=UPI0032993F7A